VFSLGRSISLTYFIYIIYLLNLSYYIWSCFYCLWFCRSINFNL